MKAHLDKTSHGLDTPNHSTNYIVQLSLYGAVGVAVVG